MHRFRRAVAFAAPIIAAFAASGCGGSKGSPGDDGGTSPVEVLCAALAPAASGTCEVTPGSGGLLLAGDVLVPGTIYRGGAVAVDAAGTITCVGCGCAAEAAGATRVTCPQAVLSPGLVNAHEHLPFSGAAPAADTGERYEHRHQWRRGLDGHTQIPTGGAASAAVQAWVELRHVMAGATSVVGAGGVAGLLRNLDRPGLLEGLPGAAAVLDTFPLGDDTTTSLAVVPCASFTGAVTTATVAAAPAWLGHVAEGIEPYAAAELACLSDANPGHDVLGFRTSLVSAIGLDAAGWAKAGAAGSMLVWSPRSNVRLYGDTSQAALADRLGVRVALGTDWLLTGSMNMLRELQCADAWNRERLGGHFTDERLWLMATRNGAEAAAAEGAIGTLAAGRLADVAVFDARVHRDHRAVIDAGPADVLLVLRGGKPLFGEAAVVAALATGCDAVDVCGAARRACLADEIGMDLAALSAAAAGAYPTFACGTPASEPTCTPSRAAAVSGSTTYTGVSSAADDDGDGIGDAQDGCPLAFDPVRPMDAGAQADADADGRPDACDPCPVSAASTCSLPDPEDVDGDGVPNEQDLCPSVADPDQADGDDDGKGDACDPCPASANPGALACLATIYSVKDGTVPPGTEVRLADALVTGRAPDGYFLQVPEDDPAFAGHDHSGVWVADPVNVRAVGERVAVGAAVVEDFFGRRQLSNPREVTQVSSGNLAPTPEAVTPAEVATGGSRAAALEGVVVVVSGVTVTDVAPPASVGDPVPTNEFVVDALLRVDDLLHLVDPWPSVDQPFASITGVLASRYGESRLEPRDAADLVPGAPALSTFGPAAFTRVGLTAAPTIPQPLTVTLTGPAPEDTFVPVVSSDPSSLAVAGGGVTVPAGASTAPVLVDGLAQAASVTLTATLGAVSLDATVRVLDPSEQPAVASLTPAVPVLPSLGTTALTVALDLPAPAGGVEIALALAPPEAGTVPATVTVPADALTASFDYVDLGVAGAATVTATLGGSFAEASLTLRSGRAGLVLNEVDYDNPLTDEAEFVEVFNAGTSPVDLTGIAIVLVNGNVGAGVGAEYARWDLGPAGTLAPGQYLVAGASVVIASLPPGTASIDRGNAGNLVQNGAPDGIALVDTGAGTVIDVLSYEGSITAATITGLGPVNLVEGNPTPALDGGTGTESLCRIPDGVDTDDAATDWAVCAAATPGAANTP